MHRLVKSSEPGEVERDHAVRLLTERAVLTRSLCRELLDDLLSVAFSPDGKTLAIGSRDKRVRLWDVQTGALKQTLIGHRGRVHSVAFSPDGKTLASGGECQTVKLWQVE